MTLHVLEISLHVAEMNVKDLFFLSASLPFLSCDIFRCIELCTNRVSVLLSSVSKFCLPGHIFDMEILGCSSIILIGKGEVYFSY